MLVENYNFRKRFSVNRAIGTMFLLCMIVVSISCKKYLDKKPDKSISTISKLSELQYTLNYDQILNGAYSPIEIAFADEYYVPASFWPTYGSDDKPLYVWNDIPVVGGGWNLPYQVVYRINVILESLQQFDRSVDPEMYDNIKGQALVFRSFAFYHAAQIWSKPYSSTASSDLGIPIRLSADINVKSERGTVKQTYDQIIKDLREAVELLPEARIGLTRPNKSAAYAVLARVCLSMGDYVNAGIYADACLKRDGALMDYNTLNASSKQPITYLNPENIFLLTVPAIGYSLTNPSNRVPVDTSLYQSYSDKDLRKVVFYEKNGTDHYFKGYYSEPGNQNLAFYGFATDEIYLIRAECSARAGNKDSAMADLNRLMVKRWKNDDSWIPFSASSAADALSKVLVERKKEVPFRGLRWSDLRRLNVEGAAITLTRELDGITYTLLPDDPRWVYLIPLDVIQLTGMEQNPR